MKKVGFIIVILLIIFGGLFYYKKTKSKESKLIEIKIINGIIKDLTNEYLLLNNNEKIIIKKDTVIIDNIILFKEQEVEIEYYNNLDKIAKKITVTKDIKIYKDENNLKIGLYENNNSSLRLIKDIKTNINKKKDIISMQIYPSNEEYINYSGRYTAFLEKKVNEIGKYNIGYILEFSLKDNTIIKEQILRPNDMYKFGNYILVYSYDRIKHKNDKFYSHITETEFDEKVVISSVKLTANRDIDKIVFPIKFTIFTYDTEDDFDEKNNIYRGISKYTIIIDEKG